MEQYLLYGLVIIVAVVAIKIFFTPIKWGLKLLLNTVLGLGLLAVFNFFGKLIGVTLGVNLINALVVGIFGPVGLVLLLILRWLTI